MVFYSTFAIAGLALGIKLDSLQVTLFYTQEAIPTPEISWGTLWPHLFSWPHSPQQGLQRDMA